MVVPRLALANCFWLLLPLLAWNVALAGGLPQRYALDDAVPGWLGWTEAALRVLVFLGPLLLPLTLAQRHQRLGAGVFAVGTLVYFASWLPLLWAPESAWSRSLPGGLAPAYTPLAVFAGIALIGESPAYGAVAAAFVAAHVAVTAHKLLAA